MVPDNTPDSSDNPDSSGQDSTPEETTPQPEVTPKEEVIDLVDLADDAAESDHTETEESQTEAGQATRRRVEAAQVVAETALIEVAQSMISSETPLDLTAVKSLPADAPESEGTETGMKHAFDQVLAAMQHAELSVQNALQDAQDSRGESS